MEGEHLLPVAPNVHLQTCHQPEQVLPCWDGKYLVTGVCSEAHGRSAASTSFCSHRSIGGGGVAEHSISHTGRTAGPAVRRGGCTGVKAMPQDPAMLPGALQTGDTFSIHACLFSLSASEKLLTRGKAGLGHGILGLPSNSHPNVAAFFPTMALTNCPYPQLSTDSRRQRHPLCYHFNTQHQGLFSINITMMHMLNNHPMGNTLCYQSEHLGIISEVWETYSLSF